MTKNQTSIDQIEGFQLVGQSGGMDVCFECLHEHGECLVSRSGTCIIPKGEPVYRIGGDDRSLTVCLACAMKISREWQQRRIKDSLYSAAHAIRHSVDMSDDREDYERLIFVNLVAAQRIALERVVAQVSDKMRIAADGGEWNAAIDSACDIIRSNIPILDGE